MYSKGKKIHEAGAVWEAQECTWAMCPFSMDTSKPHTNFIPALEDNWLAKLSQWSDIVSVHYESLSVGS